jgi:uncharacterized protein RhaS with RHS repeats
VLKQADKHNRARYYDPKIGRFISEDPVRDGSASAYGYVGNAPTLFVDPSGAVRLIVDWEQERGRTLGDMTFNLEGPEPTCTEECPGKWRLEFEIKITFTIFLGYWCPSAEAHERSHARKYLDAVRKSLGPLEEAESKAYDSEQECKQAAAGAAAAANTLLNAQRGNLLVQNFLVNVIQIPCLAQGY